MVARVDATTGAWLDSMRSVEVSVSRVDCGRLSPVLVDLRGFPAFRRKRSTPVLRPSIERESPRLGWEILSCPRRAPGAPSGSLRFLLRRAPCSRHRSRGRLPVPGGLIHVVGPCGAPSNVTGRAGSERRREQSWPNTKAETTWSWPRLVSLWSGRRDLNPRRSPWQGDTLPLSYSRDVEPGVYTARETLSTIFVLGTMF